jgi:AbrB family transcriptional regulator, transcriptional pleiotropic regulator of transition state genes
MTPRGLSRRIDQLGRIVVPVELRRALGIHEGDQLEISREGERIVLEKVEEACTFCGATEDLRHHRAKLVCRGCVAELANPWNEHG